MSHPIYSAKHLIKKGISFCKQIAKELGVPTPTGNKTFLNTWADAIVEFQSTHVEKIEIVEAKIEFDNGSGGLVEPYTILVDGIESTVNGWSYESLTHPYMVIVNGETVHRTASYGSAEGYCRGHKLTLVDSQSLAQSELEVTLESQAVEATQTVAEVQTVETIVETPLTTREDRSKLVKVIQTVEDSGFRKFVVRSGASFYTVIPGHPFHSERCECPDCHYRSVECKHQIAVSEDIAAKIQFISPNGNQLWEAVLEGQTIARIEADVDGWGYWVGKESCNSYSEAVIYIRASYAQGKLPVKAEIKPTLELEKGAFKIEVIDSKDDNGQPYSVTVSGRFIGYIWLGRGEWTINGEDWCGDWVQAATELAKSHHNAYLVTV